MHESRCGLLCSECEYVQSNGCKGCLAGDPFWGNCRVATCCIDKGHDHCGKCEEFVCKQLNDFAYDKEQGDDGKRLEVLKTWNKKG